MPIGDAQPKLILFFSDTESHATYARLLRERFPETLIAGSDSYVLLSDKGSAHRGIALAAFISGISCTGGTIDEIARYPMKYRARVEERAKTLGAMDNTCCILLTPSDRHCEELVLDTLRSALESQGILVVGGTAGGEEDGVRTCVSLNGQLFDDSSVFVLLHNEGGRIAFIKENIFVPTKHVFTVTDADPMDQVIYELDGIPAAQRIARALGVQEDELLAQLPMHPFGRIVGDDIFIAACDRIIDDDAVTTFSRIYNRTETVLLQLGDYRAIFDEALAHIEAEMPHPSFSFVANCVTRSKLLETDGCYSAFAEGLNRTLGAYVGVSGYGEQLGFEHLNHTMVIALFE